MSTVIEKILQKKGNIQDNLAIINVDKIMSHDTTTPLAINAFNTLENKTIQKDKIIIVFDHIVPPSFPEASYNQRQMKDFCRQHGLTFFEGEGICHTLMLERGYVQPGDVIAGGDSHTLVYGVASAIGLGMGSTDIAACWKTGKTWLEIPETIHIIMKGHLPSAVYPKDLALRYVQELTLSGARGKVIEFSGSLLENMSLYERMPIGLMATECSAVTEVFWNPATGLIPDSNAVYLDEIEIDANSLEPLVALPHTPDNVKTVSEIEGIEVNQVFIGSCTNGTLHDLEIAATMLNNRKINKYTRTLISPATVQIYQAALARGYIDIFLKSGAMVCMPPGCGPCIGRHLGVLGAGDKCVSTSNRNYQGRMGSPKSEVYLASPATATATALEGKIADPRRYI
jgi:3-isopropylmalate/(R)-2-methylmalate dehydratase large subunit